MKLIECYVENFGVLCDYHLKFSYGITTVKENNGKGKTTLAVFIKSMFYGLGKTTKKSLDDNERTKYFPWQGGNFGGYLDFSVNDIKYRVQRYFGKTSKGDSFILTNLTTGKTSNDYSNNLGAELFFLDEPAFVHSTYLPQKELNSTIPTSITAKLCTAFDGENDFNNYDNAISIIEQKKKFYKKTGNKGAIADAQSNIFELNRNINECIEIEKTIKQLNESLLSLVENRNILKQKLELIRKNLTNASTADSDLQKIKSYELLLTEIEEIKIKAEKLKESINNSIPDNEIIKLLKDTLSELKKYDNLIQSRNLADKKQQLSFLQSFFANGIPTDDKVASFENNIIKYNVLKSNLDNNVVSEQETKQFDELNSFFQRGIPTDEKLNEIKEKNRKLLLCKDVSVDNSQNKSFMIFTSIGVVSLILGVLLCFVLLPLGIVLSAIGFFSLIMACVKKMISSDKQKQGFIGKEEILKLSNEVYSFVRDYYAKDIDADDAISDIKVKIIEYNRLNSLFKNVKEDCKSVEKELDVVLNNINGFLEDYFQKQEINESKFNVLFNKIKINLTNYNQLSEEIDSENKKIKDLINKKEVAIFEIKSIFDKYGIRTTDFELSADKLVDVRKEYLFLSEQFENKQKSAKAFYINENISEIYERNKNLGDNNINLEINLNSLKADENELQKQFQTVTDEILKIKQRINELSLIAEPINEYYAQLEEQTEYLEKCKKELFALEKVGFFLSVAKDNITKKYLSKTYNFFEKYLKLLSDNNIKEFNIDTDLNVSIIEKGMKRETDYYSSGYKNVFDISLRLALIESVFENEKPFLILDDPFVNMDDDKVITALELLKKLSGSMQIIYLVCHSSRC